MDNIPQLPKSHPWTFMKINKVKTIALTCNSFIKSMLDIIKNFLHHPDYDIIINSIFEDDVPRYLIKPIIMINNSIPKHLYYDFTLILNIDELIHEIQTPTFYDKMKNDLCYKIYVIGLIDLIHESLIIIENLDLYC
jgi:hypothetical protein